MSAQEVARAVAALQGGDKPGALRILKSLGQAVTDDPLALQVWSMCLDGPDQEAQSLSLLERAVRLAPGDAQTHFNLGVIVQAQGDLGRAVICYQRALALSPGHLGALNNLSDLLRRRGRPDEGWTLMQAYLTGNGNPVGLELRLAKLALDTGRLDESEAWFSKAQAVEPTDPRVAFERAMLTLGREDFRNGWPRYEARFGVHGLAGLAIYPYNLPAWDGIAAPGQNILVHREQGLGDMIMFASALEGVIHEGATPHLAMAPSLHRLFSESFPKAKTWSSVTFVGAVNQPEQRFLQVCGPLDAQAPMGSLGMLRMRDGPPAARAYIRAPAAEVTRWKVRMDELEPPKKGVRRVGLVIGARRPAHSEEGMLNGRRKSIAPVDIEALAEVKDVQWFALHDRDSAGQLADIPRLRIADLSPWITDFADTAAAIANLDLVISVDTAVAHLAGAMGKPLWLLLWKNADWRWGFDRKDSYWYPDVRTFRQTKAGRWTEVVEQVAKTLG